MFSVIPAVLKKLVNNQSINQIKVQLKIIPTVALHPYLSADHYGKNFMRTMWNSWAR
jgi:hypothetical protein